MDPTTTTERVTETELEEAERLASEKPDLSEPREAQAWAQRAHPLLGNLVEELRRLREAGGGRFGQQLREALEAQILTNLNGRAELTDKCTERSLTLSVMDGQVVADVRLVIETWK